MIKFIFHEFSIQCLRINFECWKNFYKIALEDNLFLISEHCKYKFMFHWYISIEALSSMMFINSKIIIIYIYIYTYIYLCGLFKKRYCLRRMYVLKFWILLLLKFVLTHVPNILTLSPLCNFCLFVTHIKVRSVVFCLVIRKKKRIKDLYWIKCTAVLSKFSLSKFFFIEGLENFNDDVHHRYPSKMENYWRKLIRRISDSVLEKLLRRSSYRLTHAMQVSKIFGHETNDSEICFVIWTKKTIAWTGLRCSQMSVTTIPIDPKTS